MNDDENGRMKVFFFLSNFLCYIKSECANLLIYIKLSILFYFNASITDNGYTQVVGRYYFNWKGNFQIIK